MPKKKTLVPVNASVERVRIRMYRQGLGDCFLLRFSRPSGQPFHLVIDSGVIKGTANPAQLMREVAENIEKETGGRIDALVVTHEHWDHVSGFTEAREIWARMQIAEVWLAWTENPNEKLANELRNERENQKASIKAKISALVDGSSFRFDSARAERIEAVLGFMGLGLALNEENVSGTKEALDFITGRAKKVLYHSPQDILTRKEIPGVRIYVLGPPKDKKQIRKSDPSKANPEVYADPKEAFAFAGTGEVVAEVDWERPFGTSLGKDVTAAENYDRAFQEYFPSLLPETDNADPAESPNNGESRDPNWRRLSHESIEALERLALALDGDTNNTSLALAIELDDNEVLLFPADAQVGNWLSWQECTWKIGKKTVRADDLLKRTVFYKVGHHGSHNATLKDHGLEKMSHQDLIAFVPVNKAMAAKKRWKMPFAPLHKRLLEKTRNRVILADSTVPLPKPEDLTQLTTSERKQFAQRVSANELFIDFTL